MKPPLIISLVVVVIAATCPSRLNAAEPIRTVSSSSFHAISGGGNSLNPAFSGNGRFIVFVSQANNLVTNDDNALHLDVFVRDLLTGSTTLVSVNTSSLGGGNDDSNYPSISADGQFVAFQSFASNLAGNDTNGLSDVFVRDLENKTTTLVSVNSAGSGSGNGVSSNPSISADGRFVVFESTASDLVANDTNQVKDVFLRDLQLDLTVRLNDRLLGPVNGTVGSDSVSVSADGGRATFVGRTNQFSLDTGVKVYLLDRGWDNLICVSCLVTNPEFRNRQSRYVNPVISADGTAVAFIGLVDNSVGVFHSVVDSGVATLLSLDVNQFAYPEINADGRFVAYESASNAFNVFPNHVFLRDTQTGTNTLISVNRFGSGVASGTSRSPSLSSDGRFVAFLSDASDVTTNSTTRGLYLVYLRDVPAGVTTLLSVRTNGLPSAEFDSEAPAISPDGTRLAFVSLDSQLVPGDYNRSQDVFLRDVLAGTTHLVSERAATLPSFTGAGSFSVGANSISTDGRFVAFTSQDANLVANDTNGVQDIFVRDLFTGEVTLASTGTNGVSANGGSRAPAISGDGRFVVFVSDASNLVPEDNNNASDVFLRDLQTGTTTLVSLRFDGGGSANGASSTPSISADGRRVAYQSTAHNLVNNATASSTNVYIRNLSAATNILVNDLLNGSFNGASGPAISRSGRWVGFFSRSPDITASSATGLFVRDLDAGTNTLVSFSSGSQGYNDYNSIAFSANDRYLAFSATTNFVTEPKGIFVRDLLLRTNKFFFAKSGYWPVISGDGRYVSFPVARVDANRQQVVIGNVLTGRTNLITVNRSGTGGGNGDSSSPLLTFDGRYVVFTSHASDLVDNDTNNHTDVFVRDLAATNTLLISLNRDGTGAGDSLSVKPVLGGDGRTVLFQSFASDLVAQDFNNNRDIFVLRLGSSDSDGDGLDDDWELAYFGTLARDGTGDFDGDGQTDLAEYHAGTNPANDQSILRVLTLASAGGSSTTVLWSAVPGKSYRVQFMDNADDSGWNDLPGTVTATSSTGSRVDTSAASAGKRFYRVILVQ